MVEPVPPVLPVFNANGETFRVRCTSAGLFYRARVTLCKLVISLVEAIRDAAAFCLAWCYLASPVCSPMMRYFKGVAPVRSQVPVLEIIKMT